MYKYFILVNFENSNLKKTSNLRVMHDNNDFYLKTIISRQETNYSELVLNTSGSLCRDMTVPCRSFVAILSLQVY